jgi:type VI secretion system secreted protein Hcp
MRLGTKRFLGVLVVALVFTAPGAALADTIIAQCEGENQGVIEGDATMAGREGWMNVFGFGHGVVMPFDPASGQASGRRQHQPLRLYKGIDQATPRLYRALVTGEHLKQCYVQFFRNNKINGKLENYFTITIQNAFLSDITAASGSEGAGSREVASFVYQKITWTYVDGDIETEDFWSLGN